MRFNRGYTIILCRCVRLCVILSSNWHPQMNQRQWEKQHKAKVVKSKKKKKSLLKTCIFAFWDKLLQKATINEYFARTKTWWGDDTLQKTISHHVTLTTFVTNCWAIVWIVVVKKSAVFGGFLKNQGIPTKSPSMSKDVVRWVARPKKGCLVLFCGLKLWGAQRWLSCVGKRVAQKWCAETMVQSQVWKGCFVMIDSRFL